MLLLSTAAVALGAHGAVDIAVVNRPGAQAAAQEAAERKEKPLQGICVAIHGWLFFMALFCPLGSLV